MKSKEQIKEDLLKCGFLLETPVSPKVGDKWFPSTEGITLDDQLNELFYDRMIATISTGSVEKDLIYVELLKFDETSPTFPTYIFNRNVKKIEL